MTIASGGGGGGGVGWGVCVWGRGGRRINLKVFILLNSYEFMDNDGCSTSNRPSVLPLISRSLQ